jgi:hypothetical protein
MKALIGFNGQKGHTDMPELVGISHKKRHLIASNGVLNG